MLACITACVWLESAALPVQAEHYAVLYITFTGRCTHPQPTYVLARILLSSRALLAGITLLQLPCSTVLCLVRPCSCRVYKQDEPQTPPPVFHLQPYWKLELEESNLSRIRGTQCCENNKWCQDCQGPQVVIDKRDQGILSNWTLVLREYIPHLVFAL